MPLATNRVPGQTITAADINSIAVDVNAMSSRVLDSVGEVALDGAYRYRGTIPPPSSTVNHTAEITNRLARARILGGGVVVLDPQVYCVEDLEIPECVTLMGSLHGTGSVFTEMNNSAAGQVGGTRRGSVQLRRQGAYTGRISDKSVVRMPHNGSALVGITISGEGATGLGGAGTAPPPVLVLAGLEQRLQTVRVVNTPGIGIDVQQGQNSHFVDVHVNYCGGGTETAPAVRVWSIDASTHTTNTPTFDRWHIEHCTGIGLDVAYDAVNATPDNATYWAEFVGFNRLHIEAAEADNASTLPLIRVGNIRQVDLISPTLFRKSGSGPLIQYKEQTARAVAGIGSLNVIGGALMSYGTQTGLTPMPYLIDLVSGSKFSVSGGANLIGYSVAAIRAQSTFGASVTVEPSAAVTALTNHPTLPVMEDNRTARTLVPLVGDMQLRGHLRSYQATATGSSFTTGTANTGVAATATDVRGSFSFGTTATPPGAGVRAFRIIFNKPYPGTTPPVVMLTATNAASLALGAWPVLVTGSGAYTAFDIYCTNAPAASQAAGVYAFNYAIIG